MEKAAACQLTVDGIKVHGDFNKIDDSCPNVNAKSFNLMCQRCYRSNRGSRAEWVIRDTPRYVMVLLFSSWRLL